LDVGVALANLIGRAGRPLFRSYCEKELGRTPPLLSPDDDLRSFARVMEVAVRRDFRGADYIRTWRILQRVADLSARNRKDCLRFAALQLGADIGALRRSAFQEALFCYLEHRDVFFVAEAVMARGRWGHSEQFCDVFLLDAECRPERFLALIAPFREAVRLMLAALTGEAVYLEVDPVLVPPLLPPGAKEQLQVQITWGDQSEPIPILNEEGQGLINPPIQRVAGLALGANGRTLTVFGVRLRQEGRESLARLFSDMLCPASSRPSIIPRLGFLLHGFANPVMPTFPPKSDIAGFATQEIQYIPQGCSNPVTQRITVPLTPWASISQERGEAHARGELSGACVQTVWFRIDLKVSSFFPHGRQIRGCITRNGYWIESGLDVDYYIAEACFTHLKLYKRPDDLLTGVG